MRLFNVTKQNIILKSTISVGIILLLIKTVTLFKELYIANTFGISDSFDSFIMAFSIPSFASAVISGTLNVAFTPYYINVLKTEGNTKAKTLVTNFIILAVFTLLLVTITLAFLGPYLINLIASGFNNTKLDLTNSLYLYCLPTIFFTGMISILSSIFYSIDKFKFVTFTTMIQPISIILVVSLFYGYNGIYSLVFGLNIGIILQFIILYNLLNRELKSKVRFKWQKESPSIKPILLQFIPAISASLILSSTTLVDQSMVSTLGSGSVSILNYGNKFVAVILQIGSIALTTTLLPYFSKLATAHNYQKVKENFNLYCKIIIGISIPLILLFILFSNDIINIFFNFSKNDSILVSQVQTIFVLQVPFYLLGILSVRVISALMGNHIMLYGNIFSVLINILFNFILMKYLGVVGIALSTTLVYVFSFIYLRIMLIRLINKRSKAVDG